MDPKSVLSKTGHLTFEMPGRINGHSRAVWDQGISLTKGTNGIHATHDTALIVCLSISLTNGTVKGLGHIQAGHWVEMAYDEGNKIAATSYAFIFAVKEITTSKDKSETWVCFNWAENVAKLRTTMLKKFSLKSTDWVLSDQFQVYDLSAVRAIIGPSEYGELRTFASACPTGQNPARLVSDVMVAGAKGLVVCLTPHICFIALPILRLCAKTVQPVVENGAHRHRAPMSAKSTTGKAGHAGVLNETDEEDQDVPATVKPTRGPKETPRKRQRSPSPSPSPVAKQTTKKVTVSVARTEAISDDVDSEKSDSGARAHQHKSKKLRSIAISTTPAQRSTPQKVASQPRFATATTQTPKVSGGNSDNDNGLSGRMGEY